MEAPQEAPDTPLCLRGLFLPETSKIILFYFIQRPFLQKKDNTIATLTENSVSPISVYSNYARGQKLGKIVEKSRYI